jgi:hypothetical protein
MLCSKIIAVCSDIHRERISKLCGQNVEFVEVKPGGTERNHRALNAYARGQLYLSLPSDLDSAALLV